MYPILNPTSRVPPRIGRSLWLRVSAPLFVLCLLLTAGVLAGRVSSVLAEESDAIPDAPGSISGVVWGPNGAPAANILVELYRRGNTFPYSFMRTTTTQADGSYHFGLLSAGFYRMRYSDPTQRLGGLYYPLALSPSDSQEIPVAGGDVTGIDIVMPLAGSISGVITGVVTSGSQNVLLYVYRMTSQRWEVAASTRLVITPAAPAVSYSIGGIAPSVYRVCTYLEYPYYPYDEGRHRCYKDVATSIENAVDLVVESGTVVTNVNFALSGIADLAIISGRVTSEQGEPLSDITVKLLRRFDRRWREYQTATTNANGDYAFPYLSPDSYKLGFFDTASIYINEYYTDTPYDYTATPITVGRYEQRSVDVALAQGGVITGRVTIFGEADGFLTQVYAIQADRNPDSCCFHGEYDNDAGYYRIVGLRPDAYFVRAEKYVSGGQYLTGYYGGANSSSAVSVTVAGAVTMPNIDIDVGYGAFEAVIGGQVTNSQGKPLENIQVELYYGPNSEDFFYKTTTGAEGRYSVEGLLDDSYFLGFRDPTDLYAREFYSGSSTLSNASGLYTSGSRPMTQVNVSLVRLGGLSGRATNIFGAGASQIVVSLLSHNSPSRAIASTTTDLYGSYVISGVRPGRYVVKFQHNQQPVPPFYYHQRMEFDEADLVTVEEGAITPNINQVIGGAPTALGVENEPSAPASQRAYLPLVAR